MIGCGRALQGANQANSLPYLLLTKIDLINQNIKILKRILCTCVGSLVVSWFFAKGGEKRTNMTDLLLFLPFVYWCSVQFFF